MNAMLNAQVHREDLKLLLQQGFPSHSLYPPPITRVTAKIPGNHSQSSWDMNPAVNMLMIR